MKTRKIFKTLVKELENNKILLLVGPRQVGKTTLLKQLQSEIKDKKNAFIDLEKSNLRELLDENPENVFQISAIDSKDQQIIFIDEVQYLHNPSNFLKLLYDEYHNNVKLVVSGSSSFYIDQKFKDSLMGRKNMYEILTLDFEEFLDFKEEIEIKNQVFISHKIPLLIRNRVEELFLEYITFGGYPEVVLMEDKDEKIQKLQTLASDYIKRDIYDSNIEESKKFFNLLRILATQTGNLVNKNDLGKTLGLSNTTIDKYLYVMEKSFCIGLVSPFWSNIKAEITKMQKVYFFDLGLRNAILDTFESIHKRLDKGAILENIVWRELYLKLWRKLFPIKYWRTTKDNEIDFIVEERKAYEVKFTKNLIRENKYKLFREKYPNIPLEFITFDDIFPLIIT